MGTAEGMINAMRALIGTKEDLGTNRNSLTEWYATRHGNEFRVCAWCDITVAYAADQSGNTAAVSGEHAWTVEHANAFNAAGRWFSGMMGIRPGDIVFFDWGGTRSISKIDHVGVVESVINDTTIITIEGNVNDICARRTRTSTYIAGYGRPAYDGVPVPNSTPSWPGIYLKKTSPMMHNDTVTRWQSRMRDRGWKITVDGYYGPKSETVCRQFQREKGLQVDGIVGPQAWYASWNAPIT